MAESGPTRGAERHEAEINRWRSHPWLARVLRVVIFLAPIVLSVGLIWLAGRVLPPARLGVSRFRWTIGVFVVSTASLVVLTRVSRRLMPLATLMKLTLVFPDQAPSRTRATLRRSNSKSMLREIQAAEQRGDPSSAATHGEYLVQLLHEVNEHDRLTRGHSERVRAYSELIGEELKLDDDEMNKLRWSALLHDVGKLSVPSEVLNKDGRPDDEEWEMIRGHPAASVAMLAPLRPWLGDWVHAADQHHCRWDGKGYPSDLAGEEISFAGRLVAVADAYDVMTSVRSYKKPLSADLARRELTECAGAQFDPQMVKAFLRVGLTKIRTAGGPLGWFANLIGAAQLPIPVASTVATGTWAAGVATVGVAVGAVGGNVAQVDEPKVVVAAPAAEVVLEAEQIRASGWRDEPVAVTITARGGDTEPMFAIAAPTEGEIVDVGPVTAASDDGETVWSRRVVYSPDSAFVGLDSFSYEVCVGDRCALGQVRIEIIAPLVPLAEDPPPATTAPTTTIAPPPSATTAATTTTTTTPTTTTTTTPTAPRASSPPPPATTTPTVPTATTTTTTTTTTIPIDRPPIAVADSATLTEDSSALIDVLANDDDPEGAALRIESVGAASHGTVTITLGKLRYVPEPDYFGSDAFTYTIGDGSGARATTTVSVEVTAVDDPPVVVVEDATVSEAMSVGSRVASVDATDPDGDVLTTTLGGPHAGSFTLDGDGDVVLAAPLDHETGPSLSVLVDVWDGTSHVVTALTVTVTDVDEPPIAGDDTAIGDEDTDEIIEVRRNDSDPEGRPLSWNVPSVSDRGGAITELDGVVTYRPPTDFTGIDSFSYTATDPAGNDSAPATVIVSVSSVNDAPVANGDAGTGFTTPEDTAFTTGDLTANDTDVDHPVDPTSVTITTPPTSGTAVDNGDGTITYTPDPDTNGTDTLAYTITDPAGATSAPATVTIAVTNVNDAPIANDDSGAAYTTSEDVALTTPDVTTNDTDADHSVDPTSVVITSPPSSGTAVHNGDGTITYTPDPDTNGTDSLAYTITDAGGATSAPATIRLDITPVNDPPTANDDTLSVGRGGIATTIDVRLNDTDVEPGALTVTAISDGTHGTTVDNADGTITYQHDGSATTTDSFTYNLKDAAGAIDTGTVVVTILPPDDLDGTPAVLDVCPGVYDPDQLDTDGDGLGDRCDPTSTVLSAGTFTDTTQALGGTSDTQAVALGDVDGDGDLDAVFGNDNSPNTVWLNDGAGNLTDSGQDLGSSKTSAVVLIDLDGDGDRDAAFTNDSHDVYLNDGAGVFTRTSQNIFGPKAEDLVAGDVDGDGDVDLVVAFDDGPRQVWLNDGSAGFTLGHTFGIDKARGLAMGDLDGDGDLDIVAVRDGALNPTSIWWNDGSGKFFIGLQLLSAGEGRDVEIVDLDGDGDLDIALAMGGSGDVVWLNDGFGFFAATPQTLGNGSSRGLDVGDVDGDGDVDLVLGDLAGANTVWTNDGTGLFTDTGQDLGTGATAAIALGDLDGDGTLDAVIANDGVPNTVWLN